MSSEILIVRAIGRQAELLGSAPKIAVNAVRNGLLETQFSGTTHQIVDLVVGLFDGVDIPSRAFERRNGAIIEFVRLEFEPTALASLQYF